MYHSSYGSFSGFEPCLPKQTSMVFMASSCVSCIFAVFERIGFAGGGTSFWGLRNTNNEGFLVLRADEGNNYWANSIENHPDEVYQLSNCKVWSNKFKCPRGTMAVLHNINGCDDLGDTDGNQSAQVYNVGCAGGRSRICQKSRFRVIKERTVLNCNQKKCYLKPQKASSMLLYVLIGNADKDHAELSAKEDVDRENNTAGLPEPFGEDAHAIVVVNFGGPKVQDEVNQKNILERGINHCG
mmetsp:Transcript_9409/g.13811  ORF Transcript_9409/g.13811 Transcript_9409/m.13811 type:complete len:241 (-) Transcript_9409:381-1103(-)